MRYLWNMRKGGKRAFKMIELGAVTSTTKGNTGGIYTDGGDPPFHLRPI